MSEPWRDRAAARLTPKRDLLTNLDSLPKEKLLFVCTKGLNQLALYNEKRILQKPSSEREGDHVVVEGARVYKMVSSRFVSVVVCY